MTHISLNLHACALITNYSIFVVVRSLMYSCITSSINLFMWILTDWCCFFFVACFQLPSAATNNLMRSLCFEIWNCAIFIELMMIFSFFFLLIALPRSFFHYSTGVFSAALFYITCVGATDDKTIARAFIGGFTFSICFFLIDFLTFQCPNLFSSKNFFFGNTQFPIVSLPSNSLLTKWIFARIKSNSRSNLLAHQ